jgi:capsular polysaccharide biosynthesis protein
LGAVVRATKKKKSNSTKSILSKMIGMRKEKGSEVVDVGAKKEKQKKSHCANKSKISKRS